MSTQSSNFACTSLSSPIVNHRGPLLRVALASWIAGALVASLIVQKGPPPDYMADLPQRAASSGARPDALWLRPRLPLHSPPPNLCAFIQGRRALRHLDLPYSASSTGSLRLTLPELPAGAGQLVLVLGKTLPSCRGLELLGLWGQSYGPLFRGFLMLASAQLLQLSRALPVPTDPPVASGG